MYTAIVVAQETLRETKSFPSSTLPHMHLHHSEKLQRKMSFSSTLFRKTKSSIKLLRDKKSECWNANYTVIWMPTLRCDLNANSTLWSECHLYTVIWMPTLRCDLNANSTLWSECQLYAVIWMPTQSDMYTPQIVLPTCSMSTLQNVILTYWCILTAPDTCLLSFFPQNGLKLASDNLLSHQ